MADQAFVAYRVQLPDGSEATRTSGWPQPPTHGQLADYSANRGEVYLGPVAMSPAPESAATAAPPPAPPPPPPPAPAPAVAAAPQPGIGTTLVHTFVPERSFTSELPSIIGGTLASVGGGLGVASGVLPPTPGVIPAAAGFGSATGEAAQVGLEKVMGWPPAEPGTLAERMARAGTRGATGEFVTAPVRYGVKYAAGVVRPLLKSAEALEPVLAAAEPAEGTLAHWWQGASKGGAKNVVQAWDDLGAAGQRELAGESLGDMSTVVEHLRTSGGLPLAQMTPGEIARTTVPGMVLASTGHPYLGAGYTIAAEEMSKRAPRLLLYPPARTFLAGLPPVARAVAPPASFLLRTAGQAGAATPAGAPGYQ